MLCRTPEYLQWGHAEMRVGIHWKRLVSGTVRPYNLNQCIQIVLLRSAAATDFDAVLIRAYTDLNSSQPCSTEDITCDPVYRQRYLDLVYREMPKLSEDEILRRLSYLRKRSLLPRFGRRPRKTIASR
jgi:hypothetical protein